jgi:hypothetical protein
VSVEWNNLNQVGRAEMTGYEAGKRDERERIIKLLEEARDKCACYREVGMPVCRHQLSVDEQIALIKGENK